MNEEESRQVVHLLVYGPHGLSLDLIEEDGIIIIMVFVVVR